MIAFHDYACDYRTRRSAGTCSRKMGSTLDSFRLRQFVRVNGSRTLVVFCAVRIEGTHLRGHLRLGSRSSEVRNGRSWESEVLRSRGDRAPVFTCLALFELG
jgi:hypothetical protein